MSNFNFLALIVSEIWGGRKFALGDAAPLARPLEKNFYTKKCKWRYLNVCIISTFYL